MKFKFFEAFSYDEELDDAYSLVHEYIYDAIEELQNKPLEDYLTWYRNELSIHIRNPKILKTAVTDQYIEAVDCGKIKRPKTMITSQLTDYISANKHLLGNVPALLKNCPDHLQHELKLVIDTAELTESLNEDMSATCKKLLSEFIKKHPDLLNNDLDELYLLCPVGLKRELVELLNSVNIKINKELINKFEFLVTEYTLQDLDRIVIDHDGKPGTTTDNVYYIITNWDKFDFPAYEELNEDLLTEKMWVRLEDNIKPNPFYFYTTNKNITSDINTLIDVISRSGSGTYKQQLDQDILKELRANYATALSSGVTYTLTPIKPKIAVTEEELSANKTRIITLTDRSLRREAENDILISTGKNPKEWLIHHKIKGEADNILSNIALVSRNSASKLDDAVAHAIHKILENQGNPRGTITPATFHVNIEENVRGHWAVTHTVDITIR